MEGVIQLIDAGGFRWVVRNRSPRDDKYHNHPPGAYFAHVFLENQEGVIVVSGKHWAATPLDALITAYGAAKQSDEAQ